jgi:hypothetical protein
MGGIADLLALGYKLPDMPRMGVPGLDFAMANRNKLLDMLGVGDVQKTAEALSYGNRVGTGAGMTYQPLPETLGAAMTVAPMVAPAARMAGQGAMATGRFVAPKAGQLAEQYMVSTGGILPLDVYHGTPHTLPPTPRNPLGEFDASKIGTGEGAQVYGYGTYVAENPIVAIEYAKANRGRGAAVDNLLDALSPGIQVNAMKALNMKDGVMRQATLDDLIAKNPKDAKILKNIIEQKVGNLYKIDLPDAKIAKMLDWDKLLSEQPKAVQNILLPYQKEIGGSFGTGEQTLKAIAFERRMKGLDDSPAAVAQQLKEMGIPGVQYLDAGSRNVAGGTRNFVVFPGEEKSMTILERNGQPAQMSVAEQIDNINEVLKKKRKK